MLTRVPRTEIAFRRRLDFLLAQEMARGSFGLIVVDPPEDDEIICDLCNAEVDGEMVFLDMRRKDALCDNCASRLT